MTIFDYIVIGIISSSALLSVTRGLVHEIVSLLAWIIAFFVASRYSINAAPLLSDWIVNESIRLLTAFSVMFFVVLLVTMLASRLLSVLVRGVGLGLIDRMLGALFGIVRGLVIILFLITAAGFTPLPQQPFWQQAVLSEPLEIMAADVIPWLPQDFRNLIGFAK
ncbi:membrane protein required for colicin V production [Nitrosomonas eutropha]|uniref:CvpA family protein n=1 Tax=Nitrosomonas TaxID=914 RepID=UPI00088E6D46|nr:MULTISPECIES: CvpA family protein [Nitrosomonas]MXS79454.1 CvpA family protein [Nitrosomonas sp. GH22]SCX08987.1 membrane protein required for colicin V production [Nitrosomonas eutropha]SDV99532.1 membrane protein required for colicin V production [Nitrosomonas eutropha]